MEPVLNYHGDFSVENGVNFKNILMNTNTLLQKETVQKIIF